MARFGCLLIIVGMAALFLLVVLPVLPLFEESEFFDNMLVPVLCPNGEISRELYETYDYEGTGYSMYVRCENSEGEDVDVTVMWILLGVGGFLVPFLIGLTMFIAGVNKAVRGIVPSNVMANYSSGMPTTFSSGAGFNPNNAAGGSLAERLKELDNARSQGLLTEEEYQAMRQKILGGE